MNTLALPSWSCINCLSDNLSSTYICISCNQLNQSIRSSIMTRPIIQYSHAPVPPMHEPQPQTRCVTCLAPLANSRYICDMCTAQVRHPVEPGALLRIGMADDRWQCDNCGVINDTGSACVSCSMLRRAIKGRPLHRGKY